METGMLMNRRVIYKTALASGMLVFANLAMAGDVKLDTGIDVEWVEQRVKLLENDTNIDSSNQILKPFAQVAYVGRDIRASFEGTYNYVHRQLDGETQNYPELSYSADYDVVAGLLNISARGAQNYRSEGINSFLVDDFLLNGDNLNKTTTQQAAATLTLPRGRYFGLNSSASYRKNSSERNENNTSSAGSLFDSQSYGLSFSALSGKRIRGIRSNITGNFNYVQRSNNQDFVSQSLNFSNDINVYKQLGLAINASYENNELKTDADESFDGFREFYTIGAGIVWQSGDNRFLKALLNRSFTEPVGGIGDTEEDSFISYDVNWRFSNRTSVRGGFTKRFFGDAGNVDITYKLRNWRSSISYRESVNTNSQLANNTDDALFICPGGSTNIADCTLSDTLNPELETGETLQPIAVQNFDLNDRVVLNKNLTAQTAVTRRRTTLSLTGIKSQVEELEFDRVFDTESIKLQLSFNISARSNLSLAYNYSSIESVNSAEREDQTTREQSVNLTRKLTKRFSASISLRHLKRVGDLNRNNVSFRGLNGPLTDKRLTFRVSYNFGNG
ncbi:MAG: hypothetical protein ACJAW1_000322 [Glaciecola sp.]|jgi:uncharacterized protein (PEP-CTERM system associated)